MIRQIARTVIASSAAIGLTGVVCPVVIAVSLKDEERSDPVLQWWARTVLKAADVRPHVEGLENVPARSCVYVCNHQSHYDALHVVAFIHRHVRFIAKAELYKIPLFGRAMRASGNVKVDRSGGEHDRMALADALEAVRTRTSVLFFAEGTRSPDGELLPFKKGAALLALQAGVPILPMAVAGTKDILPKGSRLIHGGQRTALCIGEPIPTEGFVPEDRERLTARTREAVAALYERARLLCADG